MPNTISNKPGFYDDTTNESASAASRNSKPSETANASADKKPAAAKSDNKKQAGYVPFICSASSCFSFYIMRI